MKDNNTAKIQKKNSITVVTLLTLFYTNFLACSPCSPGVSTTPMNLQVGVFILKLAEEGEKWVTATYEHLESFKMRCVMFMLVGFFLHHSWIRLGYFLYACKQCFTPLLLLHWSAAPLCLEVYYIWCPLHILDTSLFSL